MELREDDEEADDPKKEDKQQEEEKEEQAEKEEKEEENKLEDAKCWGNKIEKSESVRTLKDCEELCQETEGCKAFSYRPSKKICVTFEECSEFSEESRKQ